MSGDATEPSRHTRFSLRTLLLATVFLAMALAIVVLSWELVPLRAEVQQLRNEAGYLTIEDPTKLHAIEIETESPLMWKWKVWVPNQPGTLWLHAEVGEIPAVENTTQAKRRIGSGCDMSGFSGRAGELGHEEMITARVYQGIDEKWKFAYAIGDFRSHQDLTEQEISMLRQEGGTCRSGVRGSTAVAEEGKPFVLMRRRHAIQNNTGFSLTSNDFEAELKKEGPGVLIWLDISVDP